MGRIKYLNSDLVLWCAEYFNVGLGLFELSRRFAQGINLKTTLVRFVQLKPLSNGLNICLNIYWEPMLRLFDTLPQQCREVLRHAEKGLTGLEIAAGGGESGSPSPDLTHLTCWLSSIWWDRLTRYSLNIFQHESTNVDGMLRQMFWQMLTECWDKCFDKCWDRLTRYGLNIFQHESTNVDGMFRQMLWENVETVW